MKNIYILSEKEAAAEDETLLGGKAKNMAWLTRQGFKVPQWFVLTTDAFSLQLDHGGLEEWLMSQLTIIEKDNSKTAEVSQVIRDKIEKGPLHPELLSLIEDNLKSVPNWQKELFAVRSSALGEDAEAASFAGQMDSYLFQNGIDAIADSVLKVFGSAFTERAVQYRMRHGMDLKETKAAVIVQRMINGQVAGVLFTTHPSKGDRKQGLVSGSYGSGEGIVSGLCNADEFSFDLNGTVLESQINDKDIKLVFDEEKGSGLIQKDVPPELRNAPCLNELQVKELSKQGRSIANKMMSPQDIEWSIENGKIFILQTRPITSLPPPQQAKGERIVWDNSNIQESYCGVTTPLTFSFALRGYRSVYMQTYGVLGLKGKHLAAIEPALSNMLGLIRGRIFYNINNWYRALLVLPGFKTNKADMERMMGLQDPVDLVEGQDLTTLDKIKRLPLTLTALYKLLTGFKQLQASVPRFRSHFETIYKQVDRGNLHTLEVAELIDLLAYIDRELVGRWETPIINDFYVMMMNGKVHRWLQDIGLENPELVQNNLMSGEEGVESTEPTKMLLRMCAEIRADADLRSLFDAYSNDKLLATLQVKSPVFHALCLEYIERYGDRSIGELKLESVTLRQDSSFMFAVLRNFLGRDDLTLENLAENEQKFRSSAETEAYDLVYKKHGARKLRKFKKDLGRLRDSVKNRENMRLARTRAFGLARDIYLEIGNQFAFYGVLEEARDIFYLRVEDLDHYMEGTSTNADFKPLVAGRKEEFARYETEEIPHHFKTYGPVYHHNEFRYDGEHQDVEAGEQLQGIGCYPGIVEKNIKLIFSPDDELNLDGQILCTVRTDPGWAPLFPTAGGILVERGSTLSHSAVVARELGIPAVVNIPGLTKIMQNGERVIMDGGKGTIIRLDYQEESEEPEKPEKPEEPEKSEE